MDVQPKRWCELRVLTVSGAEGTQTLLELHDGNERAARDAGLAWLGCDGRVSSVPNRGPLEPSQRPAQGHDAVALSKLVQAVRGVGPMTEAALKAHGITTVEQLRLHVQDTLHGQWAEVEAYLTCTLDLRGKLLRVVFDEVMALPAVAAL